MGEDAKFRHELKHYINYSDYLSIRNRLRTIMHIDKNADSKNEYRIRSLYFDNIYDKALMEKVEVLQDELEEARMASGDNTDADYGVVLRVKPEKVDQIKVPLWHTY